MVYVVDVFVGVGACDGGGSVAADILYFNYIYGVIIGPFIPHIISNVTPKHFLMFLILYPSFSFFICND